MSRRSLPILSPSSVEPATILPADMSLLGVCHGCNGGCCVGRTLATATERERIVAATGFDGFTHWAGDFFFLERGPCPYLSLGRCSVQTWKPFVCQIFPFVPRVVDGDFWLYCVGECDAAKRLPRDFIERSKRLARSFFADCDPYAYARYWNDNKIGDFDEEKTVMKIRVFDESTPGGEV